MPDKLYVYVYSQRAAPKVEIHTHIHTYPIHNCHVIIGIRRWLTKTNKNKTNKKNNQAKSLIPFQATLFIQINRQSATICLLCCQMA